MPGDNTGTDAYEGTPGSNPQTVWYMKTPGSQGYRTFRVPSLYPGVQWPQGDASEGMMERRNWSSS